MAFTADAPHRHETFDLAEAASRVSELARRTMGRAISVAADDLPAGAWVQGDSAQVEQMILNLAINAEHAMTTMRPTGDVKGGTIGVGMKRFEPDDDFLAAHPEARPRAYWALSISDQGVGMDERTLARAFDPFFTTKNPDQGSGLGLSMVHLIARQHDGFVTASSEPGVGSTFTVYLPGVEGVA
jgi:signal transduction histidine kinase